jgi:CHAD domain-containing protein
MNARKPLLDRPATKVALMLARDDLDRWSKAHKRLGQANAPDALHRFRVALRRLRSTLRAFGPQLKPLVPRRTRRRLRRLARATGRSRNLQVEREWVAAQIEALSPEERTGAQWLDALLTARQEEADERLARRVAKDFARVKRKLRRCFKTAKSSTAGEGSRSSMTASVVLRDALRQWTRELNHRLHAIRNTADWDDAHAARISAKRTRYLLKPFRRELSAAGGTIEQLTALQDVLGALQDARVLADELRAGLVEVAAERARNVCDELLPWSAAAQSTAKPSHAAARAGLVALAGRLGAEYQATFARLREEWLEQRAAGLLVQLYQLTSDRTRRPTRRSRVLGRQPARQSRVRHTL